MKKIGKWYVFDDCEICPNYGGWVIVNGFDYNIYKTYKDAYNARLKRRDGSNKNEPVIIGKMTDEQFVNALCDNV